MESYILHSTGDTQDRSAEIRQRLTEHKVCILGSGVFYVSGVKMPDDTNLIGLGSCSEVILCPEVEEGYTVLLGSRCSVRNLTIKGAVEDTDQPTEIGTRHGVGFVGTATKENRTGQPEDSMISGCQIRSFTGGGITCRDTGYGMNSSLCVSDCRIHHCGAGINISHFSEFHKFSNVVSTKNLYGCINNGGNNVFVGCAFDGNTLGYLIDNSENQSPNNSHGSCVACTFNHSDGNQGIGIKIVGAREGYVFSDCQLFFSAIHIENAIRIQFNNFNFGKAIKARIVGQSTVAFSGSFFSSQPEFILEQDPKVWVRDCRTKTGEPVEL